MKPTSIVLFFCVSTVAFAQKKTCNCSENIEETIQQTEQNYAGYPSKVNSAAEVNYQLLKERLMLAAGRESDPKACFYLLKEYIDFFKDKHFILSYYDEQDYDSTVVAYSPSLWENKAITSIEGLWVSPDGSSKIAIRKTEDGTFQGIKVESPDSFPLGFVYFTLTADGGQYLLKSYDTFMTTTLPAKQIGNLLRLGNQAL